MKQKLFTAFFAFLMIAGIAQAQQFTGTITGTTTQTHAATANTSAVTTISITNQGAYTVICTVSINNTSGLTAGLNEFNLYVNGVLFPASIGNQSPALTTGVQTLKIAVPLVIATTGNNSFQFSASNNIASPSTGSVTYGPVLCEFYTDASAQATQALITQQAADIAALTTAVTNLTNTSTTQSAALTDLQTRMASLQSQLAGINTNSSATQLTAIQSQLNQMTKDIKKYGMTTSNPWFLANFGLDGATFGSSIYNNIGSNADGYKTYKNSQQNRPTKYVKPKY
jgi:hypothetical protein